MQHSVEPFKKALRVEILIDKADALGHYQTNAAGFRRRLHEYLQSVGAAVLHTLDRLGQEGEVGHVKWFDDDKGYGFITIRESREEFFVHRKQIDGAEEYKTLKKGQRVRFHRVTGGESNEAVNVAPEDEVPPPGD